jgi:apolipoprotein N-acyltransferase
MVNVSNIAWFGNTLAVDQHLNISRMRAIELQRPMLRATNTGATAIIDHQGRVTAALPRFTRGSLVGSFEGRLGLTPFAQWASVWGLGPLWALCLGVVALAWGWRQRP